MSNGYFNGQTRSKLTGGKVVSTAQPGGPSPGMKMKAGFSTGVPGKTQSKDRSGGVKKLKAYPSSDGL